MKTFVAFAVVGVLGLAGYIGLHDRAFPQAAVDVTVTPAEVEETAAQYLASRGIVVDGHKRATVFETDWMGQVFLQRALGFEGSNQFVAADDDFAPWWFTSRFFQPLDQNEYYVYVDTGGEIVGFDRFLEEAAPGARLTELEAEAVVHAFAREELAIDLSAYEKGSYSVNSQLPNRTDHTFEFYVPGERIAWTEDETQAKGARALSFSVAGDEMVGFQQYIFVPDEFIRQQDTQDSYGDLYLLIAGLGEMVLLAVALVLAFMRFRDRDLHGRQFLALAAVLAVVSILATVTFISNLNFRYDTTLPWMTFVTETIAVILIAEVALALLLLFSASVGESLTREVFPNTNDFDKTRELRGRRLWSAFGVGLAVGSAFLAYITLFYIVVPRYLDVWSPVEATFSDFFASPVPFLIIISLSLAAAVGEEVTFRYLGISLVKRYAKHTFLALLVPAILWAFLHSTYPVYPMYIRGIELTIAGLAFGYIFLRYGIFAVIVAHYVVDIVLMATPLLKSGRPYLIASGALAVLSTFALPALYTFAMRFARPKALEADSASSRPANSPSINS